MKRLLFRLGRIVFTTTAIMIFVFVFFVAASVAMNRPLRPQGPTRSPTPEPGGGADMQKGVKMVLIAPEGQVDLVDTPASPVVRLTAPAGTVVTIVNFAQVDETFWYLVELANGAQGWVPAEALDVPDAQATAFDRFTFCAGDVRAPGARCGALLPLGAEALWVRWNYAGLRANDVLQPVLIVNGERYQGRPQVWRGSPTGQHLVNLRELAPPREPGTWTLWLVLNGQLAATTSVRVQ